MNYKSKCKCGAVVRRFELPDEPTYCKECGSLLYYGLESICGSFAPKEEGENDDNN